MALSDDAAVDAMLDRIAQAAAGAIIVDHTTTSPAGTKERLQRAARSGVKFVHAPVFMSPQMCRDATGLMLVSGPQGDFRLVRPGLEQMTGEVWYFGERGDLAAAYKIFGNSMIFTITAGIADVLAMAKHVGVAAGRRSRAVRQVQDRRYHPDARRENGAGRSARRPSSSPWRGKTSG